MLTIMASDLYSAGMVIILAKSCLPMQDNFDEKVIDLAWKKCHETLLLLTQYGKAAEVGLDSLCTMYDRLVLSNDIGKILKFFGFTHPSLKICY